MNKWPTHIEPYGRVSGDDGKISLLDFYRRLKELCGYENHTKMFMEMMQYVTRSNVATFVFFHTHALFRVFIGLFELQLISVLPKVILINIVILSNLNLDLLSLVK